MNNEEKKELVRLACEGYILEAEDENFIRFSIDTFAEGNHDKEKMSELASEYFREKGYTIYKEGEFYTNRNGRIEQVNAETAFIAIKEKEFYKENEVK